MKCYKCQSEKDLSAKRVDNPYEKNGRKPAESFDVKAWTIMAKERHKKLSEKYRDEEFMKARGLL